MGTIYDIMHDSDSCLLEFDRACDELMSVKLVLTDKKISNLLQVIAGSKKLYELIENCLKGFDFSREFKSVQIIGDGESFTALSRAPRKKQIAFTFCLLYSIDTNKILLQEFIHNYFMSDNIATDYALFCERLIKPFRKNVGKEFIGEDDELPFSANDGVDSVLSQDGEKTNQESDNLKMAVSALATYIGFGQTPQAYVNSQAVNEVVKDQGSSSVAKIEEKVNFKFGSSGENAELDEDIDALATNSFLVCIREIIGIAAREVNISAKAREELMIVCEAFEQAVEYSGSKSIRIMYIGLKNTIACSPLCRSLAIQSESLANLIKEYNIL